MSEALPVARLPCPKNGAGKIRTIGVELEFSGLTAREAAVVTADVFDGTLEEIDPHEFHITVPELGRFKVELDARWAHPAFVKENAKDLPEEIRDDLSKAIGYTVGAVASTVMPVEIIGPPMPYTDLGRLQPLKEALMHAGAKGTAHSAFAGFGMHLNVEAARLEAAHLLAVLRSYCILAARLRRESKLALIRQVQHYIDPYPLDFARYILRDTYAPDMDGLIADYIRFNPSRNRELDMLPLFAHVNAKLVARLLPGVKNKARPTYHFRLPNCRVDEPDWMPQQDWARWVSVEVLASDADMLAEESRDFLRLGPQTEFDARINRILDALGLGDT